MIKCQQFSKTKIINLLKNILQNKIELKMMLMTLSKLNYLLKNKYKASFKIINHHLLSFRDQL